jgi:hypothetical protein
MIESNQSPYNLAK